jgi:hypothetical protein
MGSGRDRKQTIKAARKIPVEQIREFLRDLESSADDLFLVHNDYLGGWFICPWSRTHGMAELTIEDDAFDLACVEYMKSHGYLIFDSHAQALDYANENR